MAWRPLTLAAMLVLAMGQSQAPDALARARQAYNAGQYDAAISAATDAVRIPALANPAAVVLGRSHLERFRQSASPADLEQARRALQLVVPDTLSPRDHMEFLVGLGLSLYLDGCVDGCFSASAEMFARALSRATDPADRERVFEWWASALDRQAQLGPEGERGVIYKRILERADAELDARDQSATASYWVAAASRGVGDLERAWGASIAGWVRARGLGKKGETLRNDLDRFVLQVLIPERAKLQSPDADARPAAALLIQQWEEIKKKYL